MAGAARIIQTIRIRDTTQPFDRLVRFNWPGQFVVAFAGMLASFLIAGFWYPYWRVADMDVFVVYNAFLLNDHLPQEYFDHPGYLPILLLSHWLRALYGIGLIVADSLSTLPPVANAAAFNAAWMGATQAGRVLSLLFAMGFVAAFMYLLRAFIRDWRIAGLGGFLLAFSGGMAMLMRTMRTELLAAGLFTIALLTLLVAARRGPSPWRPAVIGLAAALITLGMQSKVQVFFMICALPILLLPFGPEPGLPDTSNRGFWRTPQTAWPALAVAIGSAVLTAFLAKNILTLGLARLATSSTPLAMLPISARFYWGLVAAWIAFGMAAYAAIWRVAALETLAAMFAAIAGCMVGLLALYASFQANNVIVVFHPLEKMLLYASFSNPQLAVPSTLFSSEHMRVLGQAIYGVIARRTYFLQSSPRPTIFLEWFVVAATVIAIRRRQLGLVIAVATLMLSDWAIDTLDMARHLEQSYFLFTDPLAIIAAALLIAQLKDLQYHRWTYPVGFALVVAHVIVSQAEPVKHLFRTAGPEVLCDHDFSGIHPRFGAFPQCRKAPMPPG